MQKANCISEKFAGNFSPRIARHSDDLFPSDCAKERNSQSWPVARAGVISKSAHVDQFLAEEAFDSRDSSCELSLERVS
jgi:hypothetical protein